MNRMKFIASPALEDLNQTKDWLREEERQEGHSFICNWSIIEKCFEESRFACIRINDKSVAFVTWSSGRNVIDVLIAAVRPNFRRQGIGSELVQLVFSYLAREKHILVLEAECKPVKSESFWRQHGFIDYPPNHPQKQHTGVHLYKSLLNKQRANGIGGGFARLELWHKQPFQVSPGELPDLDIQLQLDQSGAISETVAIPAGSDWMARISLGNVFREGKVKHVFSPSCRESSFLVGIPELI